MKAKGWMFDDIGTKTDSIGTTEYPFSVPHMIFQSYNNMRGLLLDEGYYTTADGPARCPVGRVLLRPRNRRVGQNGVRC